MAASEAVFGSAARGDGDQISDRDYLIVDDDPKRLAERFTKLAADGWSVASYTFKKLEALSESGALFVQHLKQDARIVKDRNGQLSRCLNNFRPKSCYQDDIVSNSRLAALGQFPPRTSRGLLWSTDVLYVSLRNFGILSLAKRGIFEFSYEKILDLMIETGLLQAGGRNAAMKLRLFKSLYRSGEDFASPQVLEAISTTLAALPTNVFPSRVSPISPTRMLTGSAHLNSGVAYHQLRNLERYFLAAIALSPSFEASEFALNLRKWIENPRAYAAFASVHEAEQIAELRRIGKALGKFRSYPAAGR
jgi:hypothetical protein